MKIAIPLDEKGMLPDRFGKYSSPELRRDGNNICSFPIEVSGVPEGAKSLALSNANLRLRAQETRSPHGRQPRQRYPSKAS